MANLPDYNNKFPNSILFTKIVINERNWTISEDNGQRLAFLHNNQQRLACLLRFKGQIKMGFFT